MHNDLIRKVSELMTEQNAAFERLRAAAESLAAALVGGEPLEIETLVRAGDAELTRMRARLLETTSALMRFSEMRAQQTEKTPLDAAARADFESAARRLLESAGEFQKISLRARNLAAGGSSFSAACLQNCGVPPTTYRAPVLKYAEGAAR